MTGAFILCSLRYCECMYYYLVTHTCVVKGNLGLAHVVYLLSWNSQNKQIHHM